MRLSMLQLWLLTIVQRKLKAGDSNDIVACYKNSTSGMKPVFRLFCVPVIVSQNEARGS